MTSNYVGAAQDYRTDSILVWERESAEARVLRKYKTPRYFYVPCADGPFESIYGERLQRLDFQTEDEFNAAKRQFAGELHEADIPPMFKVLMNEYYNKPLPPLNFAFFDIEADIRKSMGFSTIQNPYAPVNAVTVYSSWKDEYLTLAVPPRGYDTTNFQRDVEIELRALKLDIRPKFVLCRNELELLQRFVEAIQNADLLSGWNSEFFDVPYTIERMKLTSPPLIPKLSFIGAPPPRQQTALRFGAEAITYKLYGRTHVDYLDLFKKFAQDVRYPTYSLGFVGEAEVGAPKVHFDGHFEDFYNQQFPRFCVYNAFDVGILVKLNAKRKLMQLLNTMAHDSTCLFENLLGTVRYVETALVNRAHHIHNQIVRDKPPAESHGIVDGALVLDPVAGLHEWLGSVDINSLYPSVIRSVNISPEMIVGNFTSGVCSKELRTNGSRFVPENNGQLEEWKRELISRNFDKKHPNRPPDVGAPTPGEYDWAGIVEGDDLEHTLQLTPEAEERFGLEPSITLTGAQWQELLKEMKWSLSAYGTVFDQSRGLGVIPAALEAWYAERKKLQAEKKKWQAEVKKLEAEGIEISPELDKLLGTIEETT